MEFVVGLWFLLSFDEHSCGFVVRDNGRPVDFLSSSVVCVVRELCELNRKQNPRSRCAVPRCVVLHISVYPIFFSLWQNS